MAVAIRDNIEQGTLFGNPCHVSVEIGIELGERFPKLVDFFSRAVDFEPEKLGYGEGFFDACPDIFEVAQHPGGPSIGFPAEYDVITDREIVVVASVFGARTGDEFLHRFLEGVEFPRLDLEVGMDANGL
jgi:hypothetical protein